MSHENMEDGGAKFAKGDKKKKASQMINAERERLNEMIKKMIKYYERNNIPYACEDHDGVSYNYHPKEMLLQDRTFFEADPRKLKKDAEKKQKIDELTEVGSYSSGGGAKLKHDADKVDSRCTADEQRLSTPPQCSVHDTASAVLGGDARHGASPQLLQTTPLENAADTSKTPSISDGVWDDTPSRSNPSVAKSLSKKRKRSKKIRKAIDSEASCSDGSSDENEEENNFYDSTDLHDGDPEEAKNAFNMENNPDERWVFWRELKTTGKKLFKYITKRGDRSERAYIALQGGGIIRLAVFMQEPDENVMRFERRLKIEDFYLDNDTGNVLAYDILATLSADFDVVAPASCKKEVKYKQLQCLQQITKKEYKEKKEKLQNQIEKFKKKARTLAVDAEQRQFADELQLIKGLRYQYKVSAR